MFPPSYFFGVREAVLSVWGMTSSHSDYDAVVENFWPQIRRSRWNLRWGNDTVGIARRLPAQLTTAADRSVGVQQPAVYLGRLSCRRHPANQRSFGKLHLL